MSRLFSALGSETLTRLHTCTDSPEPIVFVLLSNADDKYNKNMADAKLLSSMQRVTATSR